MDDWGLNCGTSGSNVILTWESQDVADGYYVWGSDTFSVFHLLGRSDAEDCSYVWNGFEQKDIVWIKVSAFVCANGNEVIVSESKPLRMNQFYEENMSLKAIQSYNGITISWTDMDFSDGYYVYQKKENHWECISELGDYQVTYPTVNAGDCFIVVAYKRKNDRKTCYKFSEPFEFRKCEEIVGESCDVSVVVPCYNNEVFAVRCIDSVLSSCFHNFELILVNDGSTDQTFSILKWYEENYPQAVRVLDKPNGGVADARNAGIEIAQGKAICFVDSDDMIHPKMLQMMYQSMSSFQVDVVVSQYFRYENEKRYKRYEIPYQPNTVISGEDVLSIMYKPQYFTSCVWNKMYRTDIVKKHQFPIVKIEDLAWTPYILSYCETACYINIPLYCWDRRVSSVKKTATNLIGSMREPFLFEEREKAISFYLENSQKTKKDYYVGVATRRIIYYMEGCKSKDNPYAGFLQRLDETYGPLKENPCILSDQVTLSKLNEMYKRV